MNSKALPKFPVPEVDNLRKATPEQQASELITLRLFVGELFTWCKDYVSTGEMPGEAAARFTAIEQEMLHFPLTKDLQVFIDGHNKNMARIEADLSEIHQALTSLSERITAIGLAQIEDRL